MLFISVVTKAANTTILDNNININNNKAWLQNKSTKTQNRGV